MNNIAIIWFGPFGQALTKILLQASEETYIFAIDIHRAQVSDAINLEFVEYADRITALSKTYNEVTYQQAIADADLVIIAVWSTYMLPVMQEVLPLMRSDACVMNVNKWLSPHGLSFVQEFEKLETDVIYATLAGGMAAYDVMDGTPTRATIGVSDPQMIPKLQKIFQSELFGSQIVDDVRGVEYAWVLKNIISIQAGKLQWEQELSVVQDQIDELVARCTHQIQDQAAELGIDPTTYDQTYCRDHPVYGDIRTSCYGETRNMRLGREWAKLWDLHQAIQRFEDQGITVEWVNTLRTIQDIPDHPLLRLAFVQELMELVED